MEKKLKNILKTFVRYITEDRFIFAEEKSF
jgi:hypothetical protein